MKAVSWFRKAAGLGHANGQMSLALCYYTGQGVEDSCALAAEWGCKAADQGNTGAQWLVGELFAHGAVGVEKDLPLGKKYLELSAAQGFGRAAALLKELRKCVACGELVLHHIICSRCHNKRCYNAQCQMKHWDSATDPHKLHCFMRRESAGALGSSSEPADPIADSY